MHFGSGEALLTPKREYFAGRHEDDAEGCHVSEDNDDGWHTHHLSE